MLADLQRQHNATYRLGGHYDIRDFLITNRVVAQVIGQEALPTGSGETLFVAQDDHGLGMSLYLDEALLERAARAYPLGQVNPDVLPELCQVIEGVSHFNCMAFKAGNDRAVSLLELELQGEVDKFVACTQIAISNADTECLRHLHRWLFGDVAFHDELDAKALARYQAANDYAARFCQYLGQAFSRGDQTALEELRVFFRLPIADKMSFIHARCWR